MTKLTLMIDTIVNIDPGQPDTAQLTRILNAVGNDITLVFTNYCESEGLNLSTQTEIEGAVKKFVDAHISNSAVLP